MTTSPARGLNRVITDTFGLIARGCDSPLLQHALCRPPQDQVIAEFRAAGSRRIADIGCGTGILTTRIENELRPDRVFGIGASPGMPAQACARSSRATWLQSPAELPPFGDETLDAVVTTSAFHFFDQPAAASELGGDTRDYEYLRNLLPGKGADVTVVEIADCGHDIP